MRKVKKLASVFLALVMLISLGVTAFADNPGSPAAPEKGTITVDNPKADETYTAYKIFDVNYNRNDNAYAYTINADSEWFGVFAVLENDGTPEMNDDGTVKLKADAGLTGLTIEQTVAGGTYVVTINADFSAPAFANVLKTNIADKTGTDLTSVFDTTDNTKIVRAEAKNLDLGYYFVSSTNGALCNLTTTAPSVTIHDKNDVTFEKTGDRESVEPGEIVTYTITGKVPDTTGFSDYTYEITDTMSEGLTFNKNVAVKIGNETLTVGGAGSTEPDYWVTYDKDGNANSFMVKINVMKYQAKVGETITVTYTATVNENAVTVISENEATLTYSNDPTNSDKKETTPPQEVPVYSAKIVIDKYAKDPKNPTVDSKKLAGATFVLYKNETVTKTENGVETKETIKKYYKYTAPSGSAEAKVEWVEDKAQATAVTTDDNGAASFEGLKTGTYYLEETVAPKGYNLMKAPQEITVKAYTKVDGVEETPDQISAKLTAEAKVANSAGAMLPSTGGIGTTIFYVAGSLLILGACILLVVSRRRQGQER